MVYVSYSDLTVILTNSVAQLGLFFSGGIHLAHCSISRSDLAQIELELLDTT